MKIDKLASMLLILIFILLSCGRSNDNKNHFIKSYGFVNEPGIYYINTNKLVIKEFDDGSLIYCVADNRNNILYQSSLLATFSKYTTWYLYIDKKGDIWFYTGDYQRCTVLLKDSIENKYLFKVLPNNSAEIPKELKQKIP